MALPPYPPVHVVAYGVSEVWGWWGAIQGVLTGVHHLIVCSYQCMGLCRKIQWLAFELIVDYLGRSCIIWVVGSGTMPPDAR